MKKQLSKLQRTHTERNIIIRYIKQNEELKDQLFRQVEEKVLTYTKELVERSQMILEQNDELLTANMLIKQQAEEISRTSALLERENNELCLNIKKVQQDRVMSVPVDFNEFSQIYPDRETCFKFLSDLKWTKGYSCRKCGHDHYSHRHLPYTRRCSKCGYEESVLAYTLFQNSRIPINKAFYMLFLMYSTKGKISSHKLSEIVDIRQGTCWAFRTRIMKKMDCKKKQLQNAGEKGWILLLMDETY